MEPHETQRLNSQRQELADLEQRIPVEAANLTKILEEQARVVRETNEYKAKVEKDLKERTETLVFEEKNITEKKAKSVEELSKAKAELDSNINSNKKHLKEISNLNSSILHAQDEKEKLDANVVELEAKVKELFALTVNYESMKAKLEEVTIEYKRKENEVKNLASLASMEVHRKQEEVNNLKLEYADLVIKREKAQYELKSYTDQMYRNMNDYQIVKDRLEGVWKKTFPELRLPLD